MSPETAGLEYAKEISADIALTNPPHRRETEVDWDTDLAEDVKGECSSKYGAVELCQVDKDSHLGEIYLRFTDLSGAASAIGGLNGRFFGGRKVSAE